MSQCAFDLFKFVRLHISVRIAVMVPTLPVSSNDQKESSRLQKNWMTELQIRCKFWDKRIGARQALQVYIHTHATNGNFSGFAEG